MNSKATWLLLALAAVLLAWIVLVQPRVGSTRMAPMVGGYVVHFDLDEVAAMEIFRAGESVAFRRTPAGWEMGPDPADRASGAAVARTLSLAQNLRVIDVIRGPEFDRSFRSAAFGLSSPKHRLRLDLGQREIEMVFGREGAAPGRVFARVGGSKDTFLVPDELLTNLLQPLDTFRDRRLVALPPQLVERVAVRRPEGEIELARDRSGWRIVRPLRARGNAAAIDDLLDQLLGAPVGEFLDPIVGGIQDGTFDAPIEISIWEEGGREPVVLRLGAETDGSRTLFHSARSALVVVPETNLKLAFATTAGLRDMRVVDLELDWVDRFALSGGGRRMEFSRTAEGWLLAGPGGTQVLPAAEIEQALAGLGSLQAAEFVNRNTNDKPDAEPGPAEEWTLEFDSWLSENTPEARAGRHPLAVIRLRRDGGNWEALVDDHPQAARLTPEAGPILSTLIRTLGGTTSGD